ncbi:MAG: cyclopropane-fatty-acyl-phospholipid synthase family protein, partial [Rhodospirillales bacterium]|nr:cyclopropane-fatty-acyl-phospholipid synthase family protein [Rhodospirillales bacterium]
MTDAPASPPRDRWFRFALRVAQMIHTGTLTLVLPDGSSHRVQASAAPSATVVLNGPRAVRRLVTGGSLGLAEAYIEGLWDSPDIGAVMALAAANEAEWERLLNGRPWVRAVARLAHALRANTRRGAQRNITEHYDLGNEFYAAWLDPSMTYSSAIFEGGARGLEEAQLRKCHRLCQLLRLAPGMRLLEIGCGWGGFAEIAARDYGCSVVGITLSPAQLEYAQARIARAGLSERVELRLQDYRDVGGAFDRIASIEMFEAVGQRYWPTFFQVIRERLRKNGIAGLQVITISDRLFDNYRRGADFIQRHVFPGGMLPSKPLLQEHIERAGLAWGEAHWFGGHYAETLARWQHAFQQAWPRIVATTALSRRPCDARFKRLWE